MTDKRRRRLWAVVAPYGVVLVAVVAGLAPVWCIGVVVALPLALRVVRRSAGAAEYAAVFAGQVILGYIIKAIVR